MSKQFNIVLWFGGALAGGAIGGSVAWFVINQMWLVNGQGMLARAGWPLDNPAMFTAAGALLSFTNAYLQRIRRQQRSADSAIVAQHLGLTAIDDDESLTRPKMPFFEHWDKAENRFEGKWHDVHLETFDLTTADRGGDQTTYDYWTVVLFREIELPSFDCLTKTWSTLVERTVRPMMHFAADELDLFTRQAVAEFNRHYQLTWLESSFTDTAPLQEEEQVRQLFRAPLLAEFARRPGFRVQASDGCLIVAQQGFIPSTDRNRLVQQAIELRTALQKPIHPSCAVIPAGSGKEIGRQRNRMAGRVMGGLCGGIAGFFGGFIVFASFMFGRGLPGQMNLSFPFLFFGAVFGGLFVGVIFGAWIGGKLANRRYTSEGPPALVNSAHSNFGMVAGAILGWILGGLVGLGITVLLAPLLKMDWLVPFLMFTPPLAGLFLGACFGNRFSQRLRARRQLRSKA